MSGIVPRVEMAPGADLTADPLSWVWTNVTASTRARVLAVNRGKTSGGANEVQPGSMSVAFANPDGIYTPGRADSIYYPNLKRGMPVRATVTGQRDPYLALTGTSGSRASTPDNAALDIVGDLSVAVEFECPLRVPPFETFWELGPTKWSEPSNMSWRLLLSYDGTLIFQWTTGGTSATKLSFAGRLGIPRPDAGILTVGFYLDVDNGVGNKRIRWYVVRGGTIDDLVASPATYLHETEATSGTTSIFSGTAPVEIGDNSGSSDNASAAGKIRRAIVRAGTMDAGSIVANPTFTAQTVGATSFTDSATRVWTVAGPASIIDDQVRMLGELGAAAPAWPGGGPNNEAAEIQWDVQGPLSRLRQGAKPKFSSLYNRIANSFLTSNVIAYWPLEDGAESTSGFSPIPGVVPMQVGGDWEWAADSTNPASSPLPHVDGTIAYSGQVPTSLRTIGLTQFRVDLFVKIDTPNATPATNVIGISSSGTVARWTIAVDSSNVGISGLDAFGGALVSSGAAVNATFFGGWTLWSFNVEQSGGNIAWSLNVVPASTGTATTYSGSVAGTVGICNGVSNWGGGAPTSGGISFGHIIVSKGLSLGWLAPADTAYRGEPAGRRFHRLCQENGIQPLVDGVYSIYWDDAQAAGSKPMGEQRPGTILGLLEECALVENARIGESRELRGLTYRSDHANQNPALQITAELGHPFTPTHDTQQLVNDVTISLPGGTSYQLVDQVSIDDSDLYDDSRTVNAETPLQLPDLAGWWLHEGTWPGMRVPVLQINLGNNPALFDLWLAVQPGDLIRFNLLPAGYSEVPLDVLVDGWTEDLSIFQWAVSLNVSPAGPWQIGVRDDADLGIRDTGGSTLNSAFAAGTDTSMSVATTLGPLWAVTSATNSALPFDVNVGGYRIAATAIGAASGQVQTFTVSKTIVNGLKARTIPAGTAVSVWRPARRAF